MIVGLAQTSPTDLTSQSCVKMQTGCVLSPDRINLTGLWLVVKPTTVVEYTCKMAVLYGEQGGEPEVRDNKKNLPKQIPKISGYGFTLTFAIFLEVVVACFFSPSGGVHVHECRKWHDCSYRKAVSQTQTLSVGHVVSLAHFPTLSVELLYFNIASRSS